MGILSKKNSSFKPLKLDLYDKKILSLLCDNLRTPFSQIARLLNITPQRVKYKVDGFIKNNLISPALFLNFSLLNIPSYVVFIDNLNSELVDSLMTDDEVFFFFQVVGSFRYVVNVVTFDFDKFVNKYLKNSTFSYYLIKKAIPGYFNPFHLDFDLNAFIKEDKPYSLSKKEFLFLAELSKKPDASIMELSKSTGLDRKTVKGYLKKLIDSNVIQGIRYSADLFKMGFSTYLFFHIKFPSRIRKELTEFIFTHPYSGFMFFGDDEVSFDFFSYSFVELRDFFIALDGFSDLSINVFFHTDLFFIDLVPRRVIDYFYESSQ